MHASLVCCVFLVFGLQILKSAFHPDKVRRHWDNPWIFNTFGFVPITWVVLTVLLGEEIDKAAYSVLIVRTTLQWIEMVHTISVCVSLANAPMMETGVAPFFLYVDLTP